MKCSTKWIALSLLLIVGSAVAAFSTSDGEFRFAVLGDRTGGHVPGVYEEAWRETDADHPDFVITVGDSIEGGNDSTMDSEWKAVMQSLAPYRRYPIFFVPGNHDVWSIGSAQAFEKYTKRPLHYSFDFKQAHFTVLDNSRSDELPTAELMFLEKDLQTHEKQPLKFIFSHRPSWILQALLANPDFPLHRLAKRYGVQYVVAGHIHQMLRFELEGVTYLSVASSGGHLRDSGEYRKGWFFQHTLVFVQGTSVGMEIKELGPPFGQGRVSKPADWGTAGLNEAGAGK